MEHITPFIKHNYAKLKDLYLSMTFGNRVVASLLFTTLLISLGYLIVGGIKPTDPRSKMMLLHDGYSFNSNEKRAANYAFAKEGLGDHQWVGDQLQVPTNRKIVYSLALASNNVIDANGLAQQKAADGLSPWQSSRMVDTKMLTAKTQDAVDTIKRIPGIASASILYHRRPEWERNVWARRQVMSVAVSVEAIENKPLSAETITAIGNIIATAFGITDRSKEISITDSKHNRSYDGFGEEVSSALGAYLRHQIRHQETWNKRIYDLLSQIDGLKVETTVELTKHRTQQLFTIEHDRPTPLVTHELDYHLNRKGYDRFFRPGQTAMGSRELIDPMGNIGPQNELDEKKREAEITHALPGREMKEEMLPYIPLRVTASLQIPRDYLVKIWQARNRLLGGESNAVPTPEELTAEEEKFALETKRNVGNLMLFYRTNNKIDPMELVDVTFVDRDFPVVPELTAWQQFKLFMQHHWQDISLIGLVCGGLVVLWSISKQPKPEDIVIYEGLETPLEAIDARIAEQRRLEAEASAAITAAAEEMGPEFENTLGELGSLRSLKDEIAELIAKNPEAAAAVIRQWVGNAVLVEAKT